jgi:hypothetical protein
MLGTCESERQNGDGGGEPQDRQAPRPRSQWAESAQRRRRPANDVT